MSPIIYIIIGIIIGFVIGRRFESKKSKPSLNPKQLGKEKIIQHVKEEGSITNNGVEKLLGVANTTAYRYLEELEQEGVIEQHGKTGRNVEYRLKK